MRVLTQTEAPLLLSLSFLAILRAVVAKVYIVSFRTLDDRRPSKFIVLADNMRSAIKMAWEHGGTEFIALGPRRPLLMLTAVDGISKATDNMIRELDGGA